MDNNEMHNDKEARRVQRERNVYHNRMNKAYWIRRFSVLAAGVVLAIAALILYYAYSWSIGVVICFLLLCVLSVLEIAFWGNCPWCDTYIPSRPLLIQHCPYCGESLEYSEELEELDRHLKQQELSDNPDDTE